MKIFIKSLKYIQQISDNGSEFVNQSFQEFCKDNNIIHKTTMSHSPKQNSLIENFNGKLRKMMNDLFTRTNNLNWIDYLDELINSRNSTVHTTLKKAPNQIWKPEKEKELDEQELEIKDKLAQKAKKAISRNKSITLELGDHVRINLSSISSETRKRIWNLQQIFTQYQKYSFQKVKRLILNK